MVSLLFGFQRSNRRYLIHTIFNVLVYFYAALCAVLMTNTNLLSEGHIDKFSLFWFVLQAQQTNPFIRMRSITTPMCVLTIGAISACHSLCTLLSHPSVPGCTAHTHTHTMCQCNHYPLVCWSRLISSPLPCLLTAAPPHPPLLLMLSDFLYFLLPLLSFPITLSFTHSSRLFHSWDSPRKYKYRIYI